jgi:hypothetical protein
MKTISAVYKGNRVVELFEDVEIPKNIEVFVIIPEDDEERELHKQFRNTAEISFAKLWNNKEDEVWNEYL